MEHFQASKPLAANVTQSSKMQYTVEKSSSVITAETAAVRQTDLFPWTRNYVCQPLWDSHYEHAHRHFKFDSGALKRPNVVDMLTYILSLILPRDLMRDPSCGQAHRYFKLVSRERPSGSLVRRLHVRPLRWRDGQGSRETTAR